MLKYTLILCSTLLALSGFSHQAKALHNSTEIRPPGTVEIAENLYFDATEITNISWKEYQFWIKDKHGEQSEEYSKAQLDTTVWKGDLALGSVYFTHPAYNNYPVIGVSYVQAQHYCKWRSDRVNEMIYIKNNKITYTDFNKNRTEHNVPELFTYRLPTQEEWTLANKVGYSKKVMKKRVKCFEEQQKMEKDGAIFYCTTPVKNGFSNLFGIYNLEGNVSEMSATEGVSFGNSWKPKTTGTLTTEIWKYTGANNWVGIRCVCDKKP